MAMNFWNKQAADELRRADQARLDGNEGQARVSARRAAGIIVREYLRQQGVEATTMSAYEALLYTLSLPHIPFEARPVLEHLVIRVEPGGTLPVPADLVAETRQLAKLLDLVPGSDDSQPIAGSTA